MKLLRCAAMRYSGQAGMGLVRGRWRRCWRGVPVRHSSDFPVWTKTKSGSVEVTFSNERPMAISTGKLARFADGSALVQLGETSVMVTAVGRTMASQNVSFVPLVVDYRQKAAAAGRVPTNFLRRELGPSETEILTSRMIDRSLRPLFRSRPFCDTQVICNLLAVDGTHDPDIAAINGASAALLLSDIPWDGPIGAVRVGLIDDQLIVNPTRKERLASPLNLVVAASDRNHVVMLDASGNNILQQDLMKAIKFGVKESQKIIAELRKLQQLVGKPKRVIDVPVPPAPVVIRMDASLLPKVIPAEERSPEVVSSLGMPDVPAEGPPVEPTSPEKVRETMEKLAAEKLRRVFTDRSHDKFSRDQAVTEVRVATVDGLRKQYPDFESSRFSEMFSGLSKEIFRSLIFENNTRCDGRSLNDIRHIRCQAGIFSPLHGSALFERGQTQCLCTVTFDALDSAWKADPASVIISGLKEKNFMLHYEFPPYATNETGRSSAFGRREMGHGALAEKALRAVIPANYPYTIRLTSEVLESNGSSSMATVCGGTLALMDAGVPITAPAAGVAIGLVTKYNEAGDEITDYRILTDLLGIEDYLGDMDFKMSGTRTGITALQADVKIPGLPLRIVMESIQKATEAKSKILDIMSTCIKEPRKERKDNAPVTEKLDIPPHKRARFIGFGGYNLKRITAETGVQITHTDDGVFNLFAPNPMAMDEAKQIIKECLEEQREPELQFNTVYTAKVVEIREAGLMITLYDGQTSFLLPNDQLDSRRVAHPDVLGFQVGQEFSVKYWGRDPVTGRHRASRKVLMIIPSNAVKTLHR